MRTPWARAIQLHIVLEKQKKGYAVYIPELPGCISEGDTKKEAPKNIKKQTYTWKSFPAQNLNRLFQESKFYH